MKKTYASLHNHSDFSNIRGLDSIISIKNLIDTAVEKEFYAVALTDHDVLSGHINALKHYKKNHKDSGTKLILGNEVYFTKEGLTQENYEKGENFYHFLLLAKNAEGHRQLRRLSSRAWERSWTRGVMRTPSYLSDMRELIEESGQNLIATTACFGGFLGSYYQALKEESLPLMESKLKELQELFGEENFFIEIQPTELPGTIEFNKFILKNFWGKYPFVFTTDSHYARLEDKDIHKYFLLSQSQNRDVDSFYSNNYLMTMDEIAAAFPYVTEQQLERMRLNTIFIADQIEWYDLESTVHVPTVPVEVDSEIQRGLDFAKEQLKNNPDLVYIKNYLDAENIQDRVYLGKIMLGYMEKISKNYKQEYFERIDIELSEVWESSVKLGQSVAAYFVTMEKMIDLIWNDADSIVGVSRGSAMGFLTNYLLGITQLDPLTQVLTIPHWRFVHKDRPELPDR